MDSLGSEALQSGFGLFQYRKSVDIPALAMIDDVLGMAKLNAMINAKMETKQLRLSQDKRFKIHICKGQQTATKFS